VREIEIPKDVYITPRMYQKLTEKIAGKPEERILSYLMLRSLKQARYSEENLGHFALAATSYTHFTSPIRRYPDLIVHRILKDVLKQSAESWDGEIPVGTNSNSNAGDRPRSHDAHHNREGHDFSRADKPHKKHGASAPEGSQARSAAPFHPTNFTPSPKNPANPSAAPMRPNAN